MKVSIDKALEKAGVEIAPDNSLPLGKRTKKDVSRLIAAVRAAEASFNDALHEANEAALASQRLCMEYQARIADLELELRGYKLKEKLETMPNVTMSDRQLLLTNS